MRRIFTFTMVLGMAVVLGGGSVAFADCAYHKTQAGIDKTDPAKQVATISTSEKTDATQVQTAQADKPAQPVSVEKK